MATGTLHCGKDLSKHFPTSDFIASHGYINWWDSVKSSWAEVQIGELLIPVEADKLVLFFDKETRECIAFAWTDDYPREEELFPDLVDPSDSWKYVDAEDEEEIPF